MLIGTLKRENRILGRRARRIGLRVFSYMYLLRTPSYTISTFSVVEIAVCVCVWMIGIKRRWSANWGSLRGMCPLRS